jgi:hypothetical protein
MNMGRMEIFGETEEEYKKRKRIGAVIDAVSKYVLIVLLLYCAYSLHTRGFKDFVTCKWIDNSEMILLAEGKWDSGTGDRLREISSFEELEEEFGIDREVVTDSSLAFIEVRELCDCNCEGGK